MLDASITGCRIVCELVLGRRKRSCDCEFGAKVPTASLAVGQSLVVRLTHCDFESCVFLDIPLLRLPAERSNRVVRPALLKQVHQPGSDGTFRVAHQFSQNASLSAIVYGCHHKFAIDKFATHVSGRRSQRIGY